MPSFIIQKELSQPKQYLCRERLTVKYPRGCFENTAILGPYRPQTQIELSLTDTRKLGLPGIIALRPYRRDARMHACGPAGKSPCPRVSLWQNVTST